MKSFESNELLAKYVDPEKLTIYLDEVERANSRYNLFSRNLARNDLRGLVADCLVPYEIGWFKIDDGPILDVGSGWGLPAIPLLLADPGLDYTLVERSQKKSGFLALALHHLGLKAQVRGESLDALRPLAAFSLITMRRVAIDERLRKSLLRLATPGARLISFGPVFDNTPTEQVQCLEYTMDTLPTRTVLNYLLS